MTTVIDVDPATWLRNKLGTDDLWHYGNVANLLNPEILRGVEEQFNTFDVKIKLKLLLSFLQIPRRNLEGLSEDLSRIIHLAEIDGDDWVKVIAGMLKEYPRTASVHTDLSNDSETFKQTVEDIGIAVENCGHCTNLPMECSYMNRTALHHLVGSQPGPTKHFTLRRKPKSAALRAQLTQRASEIASHKKALSGASGNPIHHVGQKRPLSTGIPAREGMKGLSSLGSKNVGTSRMTPIIPPVRSTLRAPASSLKKTKLLDITEQPIGGREAKKKRKAQDTETAADGKSQKSSEQPSTTAAQQQQQDTKRGEQAETSKETEAKPRDSKEEVEASSRESFSAPATVTPSYAVLPGATSQPSYAPSLPTTQEEDRAGILRIDPNATAASKSLQRELQIRVRQQQLLQQQQQQQQPMNVESQSKTQLGKGVGGQTETNLPLRQDHLKRPEISVPTLNQFAQGSSHLKHYRIQGSAAQSLTSAPTQSQEPTAAPSTGATRQSKKELLLTKEQTLVAHEMFRSANKVTEAKKALILAFMAGDRENPFPQQGPVITIKLSEEKANVRQNDGSSQTVLVEMLFEMNYETGHWRRLKRTRVLAPTAAEEATPNQF